jgi:hypothetical protein
MSPAQDKTVNKISLLGTDTVLPASQDKQNTLVEKTGAVVHSHRDFFNGTPGILMFRNAMNSMAAWVPTITSFVAMRGLWEKYEKFAANNKESLITKIAKPVLSEKYPLGRNTGFVFAGWFTYRASTKLWNRAYDRLFAAKSAEDATATIRAMPSNFKQDLKEIVPGGLAEIVPGSLALAIIPSAFLNQKTWRIKKGDFAQAKAGWLNNTLSTGVAYSAFLEICDHIYPKVTNGKDYGDYYHKLKGLPPKETIPDDQKKFGFFTSDGAGRMLFRTAPAVLLGFAAYFNPHFGGQRWSYAKFGMPTEFGKTAGEVANNWAKDYVAWAPSFTMYTVLSQVYRDNYDKLFEKIEKHAAVKKHPASGIEKADSHVAKIEGSRIPMTVQL